MPIFEMINSRLAFKSRGLHSDPEVRAKFIFVSSRWKIFALPVEK